MSLLSSVIKFVRFIPNNWIRELFQFTQSKKSCMNLFGVVSVGFPVEQRFVYRVSLISRLHDHIDTNNRFSRKT